jgi:spermidine synthase
VTFPLLLVVGAVVGFVSLSFEILWFRVFSQVTGGTAPSFGVLLAFFLFGLAIGSLAAHWFSTERTAMAGRRALWSPAVLWIAGSLVGWLVGPAAAVAVRGPGFPAALPLVSLSAGLLGAVLPLLSHFGVEPDERSGLPIACLYLANIVGSGAGSLLTGFVLLDLFPLQRLCELLALGSVAGGALLLAASVPRLALVWVPVVAACGLLVQQATPVVYEDLWEKLQFKEKYRPEERFVQVIENRSGVITVTRSGGVYGGGAYDNVIGTSLVPDRNGILRAYAVAAVHPAPKKVLLIGLASGSWAQVLVNMPGVEHLTVVDINSGYFGLIERRDEVRSLLRNPKVNFDIDDGRRWLLAHREARFDVIVQTTTWHWRDHTTVLLSAEHFELVKSRLAEGGLFVYTTTNSLNSERTACTIFPYGFRILNAMYVGSSPLTYDKERLRPALGRWSIDGRPVFDLSREADRQRFDEILSYGPAPEPWKKGRNWFFEPCPTVLEWRKDYQVITDDNMATEWYRPWWSVPK